MENKHTINGDATTSSMTTGKTVHVLPIVGGVVRILGLLVLTARHERNTMSKITAIDILGLPSLTMKGEVGEKKIRLGQYSQVIVDGILCDVVVSNDLYACNDCVSVFGLCNYRLKNFICVGHSLAPVLSEKSDGCT